MNKEGFIIIDKPKGITSFGVVAILRKITGIKKIGHCGTLDPLATGVLVCAIGRGATKRIDTLIKSDKEYIADIELGKISDTYDIEGNVKSIEIKNKPKKKDIGIVLKKFIGEIDQIPPIFSAKKVNGKKAYDLARKGIHVEMKKNKVNIYKIILISYKFPHIKIKINCGSGTYIRSLANDVGEELKTGGIITELRRTKVGFFNLKKSISLEKLNEKNIYKKVFDL